MDGIGRGRPAITIRIQALVKEEMISDGWNCQKEFSNTHYVPGPVEDTMEKKIWILASASRPHDPALTLQVLNWYLLLYQKAPALSIKTQSPNPHSEGVVLVPAAQSTTLGFSKHPHHQQGSRKVNFPPAKVFICPKACNKKNHLTSQKTLWKAIFKEGQTDKQADRETHRQRDRPTDGQNKKTDRHTNREKHG